MSKDTRKESIKLPLPDWFKEWWRWLKSREYQAGARLWEYLNFLSLLLFILIAFLYILGFFPPYREVLSIPGLLEEVVGVLTATALGFIATPFIVLFLLVLIVSFHPKTRKWADRRFHFRDLTELEELKKRIDTIESGLASTNERLDNVEKRLDTVDNRLGNIEERLESIDAALKKLANKENSGDGNG